ncbi:aminotransferase-like domain-containing protein [Natrarchaeobius chitinivorans]|uniref:PLP-dependent aminotransferase family protein n=1 Tax=Natrarchaeobius chitinivorans TaxID=1679083 RepID=A0A3N6LXF8_NATCH|nr:PLP-dependent aminotransferase family protein [Natrarchaeobius chitinivorans]RQG95453.1 PLP-dependent aminotransferase family protein [Natrarchaeobius chitinivorans]
MADNIDAGPTDCDPVSLMTDTAQANINRSKYGSWRSIGTAETTSLTSGFPYPESFPTDQLVKSIQTVFDEEGDQALQYGGGEYAEKLESWIASREADRGIDLEESNVLITNGATHAIDTTCRAFFRPGDTLITEEPTFLGSIRTFKNLGINVVGTPLDGEGLDVSALASELELRRHNNEPLPKALYTTPSFQNPTGTTMPKRRRERLLELATEFNFVVIEDDAYRDLRYEGDPEPPLAALDDSGRVIRIGTFAKTIAPGVRLGWLVAAKPVREAIETLFAGGKNTFTRSVVGHYCADGHFADSVPTLKAEYARRRDLMLDALESHMPANVSWSEPSGGFFIWVEIDDEIAIDELLTEAIEEGVSFLPGPMFYPHDGGENAFRLSFSHVEPSEIEDGIRALGTAIHQHKSH